MVGLANDKNWWRAAAKLCSTVFVHRRKWSGAISSTNFVLLFPSISVVSSEATMWFKSVRLHRFHSWKSWNLQSPRIAQRFFPIGCQNVVHQRNVEVEIIHIFKDVWADTCLSHVYGDPFAMPPGSECWLMQIGFFFQEHSWPVWAYETWKHRQFCLKTKQEKTKNARWPFRELCEVLWYADTVLCRIPCGSRCAHRSESTGLLGPNAGWRI